MADEVDMANDIADAERERAINQARHFHPQPGIGICINCGVDVSGDARWCSAECRDDWEAYGKH